MAEDRGGATRIGAGRMITNENSNIQPILSQLLLAWKSSEMLFGPLAQPFNRGYRFWPAQRTLRTEVGSLERDADRQLPEFTIAEVI
jgi:hypothetical protein